MSLQVGLKSLGDDGQLAQVVFFWPVANATANITINDIKFIIMYGYKDVYEYSARDMDTDELNKSKDMKHLGEEVGRSWFGKVNWD